MGFKEVSSLDADTVISLGGWNKKMKKDNDTQIEGFYLGTREVPDAKKKSGIGYIHILQTAKGNVGVWGKTDMDKKMKQATPGAMTRISHTGMKETPNGEMYVYKVEIDSENTVDVDIPDQKASRPANSYSDEDSTEVDAEQDDEPDYEPSVVVPKGVSNPAERRAKVQDLLNKSRKTA